MTKKRNEISLEFVVRFRGPFGIEFEAINRDEKVEVLFYWPNGTIRNHSIISLEQFIEEIKQITQKE